MIGRDRLAVVACVLLAGCGRAETVATPPASGAQAATGVVVLYEGLPHQGNEPRAFDAERKAKPTAERQGYCFYRDPLTPNPGDAGRLLGLLQDPATFQEFSGEKKCGGFHPDYLVLQQQIIPLHSCASPARSFHGWRGPPGCG